MYTIPSVQQAAMHPGTFGRRPQEIMGCRIKIMWQRSKLDLMWTDFLDAIIPAIRLHGLAFPIIAGFFNNAVVLDEKYAMKIFTSVKKTNTTNKSDTLSKLGDDMRALRNAQNMTLSDLAETSGKSVSFLSKIERGLAQPSVTALQEIADALSVPAGWFFDTDRPVSASERPYIVCADRRRKLSFSNQSDTSYMGLEDHLLSATLDSNLALGISTYQPGGHSGDDLSAHEGDEAGLILQGTIQLTIDQEVFTLKAGGSFSFSAAVPHRYENTGTDVAQIVWANTPITLRRF